MSVLSLVFDYPFYAAGILAVAALFMLWLSGAVRFIPNNRIGVVEKLIGSRTLARGIIALNGEAGFQPEILRGGLHFFMPFQYRVHSVRLVTITQNTIGYVFARDGAPLAADQTLASNLKARDFQDARAFLLAGGQRGPQRLILREGTYALNLALFAVITGDGVHAMHLDARDGELFGRMANVIRERGGFAPVVLQGADDAIGIVTIHDGPSLAPNEIIAPTIGGDLRHPDTYHNDFQDPERFLAAGGRRGRQLQVLVEGTYYLNRLFATVEIQPKTIIEVGTVGVVVSYVGVKGRDLSGTEYSHGEMVAPGERGVWSEPLLPGKYAFNRFAGKIVAVPTTNIILKWIRGEAGSHKLDENLSEISLITKDAFEPSLPLSVVVHIDYRQASLVVQRFGDIKRLVEQTLDPMVSAYFKNIGQTRTLIQLIQERSQIQQLAGEEMREKFRRYNLELEEVLIGTPGSSKGDGAIEQILQQLRARQVAAEQLETYARQRDAAVKERELREAEARAKAQSDMTRSELSITIESNEGKAQYQRSLQQAEQIRALAVAEADKVTSIAGGEARRVRAMAEAEAERAARVGVAQALAIEEQVRAYGGPQLQLTQQVMTRFAEAIERAKIDIVPRVLIGQQAGGQGGNAFDALLGLLLSDKLAGEGGEMAPRDPQTAALAQKLRSELTGAMAAKPDKPKPAG